MVHDQQPETDFDLTVRFFPPPEDLAACLTTVYLLETRIGGGAKVTDYLQPEWGNLRFFCENAPYAKVVDPDEPEPSFVDGARFQATGPSSKPVYFEMGETRMWGIGLKPLGWAKLIAKPANESANIITDGEKHPTFRHLADLCDLLCEPSQDDEEQFAKLVQALRENLQPTRDEARIIAIHEAMVDPYLTSIDDFADAAKMHKRTLERLCNRHFGFSPRFLLRRQRMMRSLAAFMLSEGESWSRTIDRHYHDQPHFVREFHEFMGMSPTEYATIDHPILNAFMTERQRIWGSPVQTLDKPRQDLDGGNAP